MIRHLKRYYYFLIALALVSTSYTLLKPGLASPPFPSLFTSNLKNPDSVSPISSTSRDLDNDTSDRKLSRLYQYKFDDGSELSAIMVRVRKRDDFKIETYGLLTKGIDPIYIKSPSFNGSAPYSMMGLLNGKKTIQTCIVPGTMGIEQANVQLFPLLAAADKHTGSKQSFFSKLLGTDDKSDYSCLVLTYQPKIFKMDNLAWNDIIQKAQLALMDSPH